MTHLGTSYHLLFDLCGKHVNSLGDIPTRTDIDTSRNIIHIRQSKGAKDRDLYPCKSANKTKNTKPTRPTRTLILCNKHADITPNRFDMRNFILYINKLGTIKTERRC